jgi:hypothetical protein
MASIREWLLNWRLVSWRSALVACFLGYTFVGFFVVPVVVKRQIESRSEELLGRRASIDRVRCNPYTLSLTLEGFSLPDRPGSVLLSWKRLYGNAQLSSLFRWAITLKELRIEEPSVALRRFDDGRVNVLELLEALDAGEEAGGDGGGLPRAVLQKVQVVDGLIQIEDRHRPEPLHWDLGPSQVELENIATIPDREGTNRVVVGLPGGGELHIDGSVVVEPLGLQGAVKLTDNEIVSLWEAVDYLFEFSLTSGFVAFDLGYKITLEDDGLHVTVDGADVLVHNVGLRWQEHDTDILGVRSLRVEGARVEWPEQAVSADAVRIDGGTAFAWLEEDGTPSWDVLIPEETQREIVQVYGTLEERIDATARLEHFELTDASAEFEDRTFAEPQRFSIAGAQLTVNGITTTEGSTWPFEGSAVLDGGAQGRVVGEVGVSPFVVKSEVGLQDLELPPLGSYLSRFTPVRVDGGRLGIEGVATAGGDGDGVNAGFTGRVIVADFDLAETVTGSRLIQWTGLEIGGVEATLRPLGAAVGTVDVVEAGIEVIRDREGHVNVIELVDALGGGGSGDAATEGAGLPSVTIGRLRLQRCSGSLTDRTLTAPLALGLDPVNGTVDGITTTVGGIAQVNLEGEVTTGGMVRMVGVLDPMEFTRSSDLVVEVRDVQLPPLSPVFVQVMGHPVEAGATRLDTDVTIAQGSVVADLHLEADDLELGDKVAGEGLIDLPFKLGVALLKDNEGRITLDIPFEGSFDTPGFGLAAAAGAAAKEVFTEVVKSPFRLLGRIGGGGDLDLEYLEFVPGGAALDDRAVAKLDTLAVGLEERPTLQVAIHGAVDEVADRKALQKVALEASLLAAGATPEHLEGVVPLEILEGVWRDSVPAPGLDSLRDRFTTLDGDGNTAFDEIGYRRALRDALMDLEPVDPAAVAALAGQRATAIATHLVDVAGLDPSRVQRLENERVEEGGGARVACRLELRVE